HFLQHVQGIAPNRVGIIGHSEGALIGPMVAARSRDVAFLVLLAGPGMPGDSLSLLQLHALAGPSTPAAKLDAFAAINAGLYAAVTGARDSADAVARLTAARDSLLSAMPAADRPDAATRIDQELPSLLTPWMRFFLRYDSRMALRKVRVPVLALGGSLDEQVPAQQNLAGIESALETGGDKDYQVVELPGLNHLFQTATTGAPAEYATIAETIAPHVLDLVTEWISAPITPDHPFRRSVNTTRPAPIIRDGADIIGSRSPVTTGTMVGSAADAASGEVQRFTVSHRPGASSTTTVPA